MKILTAKPWTEGRAFTVLELLVVIATIMMLVGMLLPVLGRAKSKAYEASCLGNLRQLGIALALYTDDCEGRLPVAEQRPSLPVNPTNSLPRICDVLAWQVGSSNSAVFRCPQDNRGYFSAEGSSYEWAYLLNGKRLDHLEVGPSFARFVIPADQVPLLYDYENFHTSSTNARKNVLFGDGHVTPF